MKKINFNASINRSHKKFIRFTRKILTIIGREISEGSVSDEFDFVDRDDIGAGELRQFGRLATYKALTTRTRTETLYGLSFFICQLYITYIVSRIKMIHAEVRKDGIDLKTTNGTKLELLKLASKMIKGTTISEVQAIDALANYYKHQDEWVGPWGEIRHPHSQTAKILLELGLKQDSPVFMNALQLFDFKDIPQLADILENWNSNIIRLYVDELKSHEIDLDSRVFMSGSWFSTGTVFDIEKLFTSSKHGKD